MGNGNSDNGKGGNGNPPGTYLVIPYYSGDSGSRPLPSSYPFWMCNSILINGSPYGGQQLVPGQTVELSLNAINYGTLTAPALCLFFWANPTTNFTNASVNLIGSASLSLPRALLTTTTPIPWTIPQGTPAHICLLAEVTAPADPASGTYDAATDRHFGQQNVHLTTASPGGQIRVGFLMGNGKVTASRFRLEVTHVLVNRSALHHIVAKAAVLGKAEEINLKIRSDARWSPQSPHVELAAGELLDVELNARVPRDAMAGSTIILQIAQYPENGHHPVGGLGVVVLVTWQNIRRLHAQPSPGFLFRESFLAFVSHTFRNDRRKKALKVIWIQTDSEDFHILILSMKRPIRQLVSNIL
jgi:hypothetical protein